MSYRTITVAVHTKGEAMVESWTASMQLLYVVLAAKNGDWRKLKHLGAEPTPTMKLLFLKARAKYLEWRARQDIRDELEAAMPKEWIEVSPGRWLQGKVVLADPEPVTYEERIRFFHDIDTSGACRKCGNPSLRDRGSAGEYVGPPAEKCPVCWTRNEK